MSEIKVTDIEEHEDGSATLQVECDPETFAAIFNACFCFLYNFVLVIWFKKALNQNNSAVRKLDLLATSRKENKYSSR